MPDSSARVSFLFRAVEMAEEKKGGRSGQKRGNGLAAEGRASKGGEGEEDTRTFFLEGRGAEAPRVLFNSR